MTQITEELVTEGPPLPEFMAKWATMITGLPSEGTCTALQDIGRERIAQDVQWGVQNHPDGTGGDERIWQAGWFRQICKNAAEDGTLTWTHILEEEVAEALAETDPVKLRTELIQVAAVVAAWVESMDRRGRQEVLFDA